MNSYCLALSDKEEQVITVDGRVCLEQKIFEKLNYLHLEGLPWLNKKRWAEWKYEMTMIGDLEEKMPDKEVGPVGRVMGDGESGVLAEASQLFPAFRTCQMVSPWTLYNLPPLELDLVKKLFKRRMISAPGHRGLPQLLGQHYGGLLVLRISWFSNCYLQQVSTLAFHGMSGIVVGVLLGNLDQGSCKFRWGSV